MRARSAGLVTFYYALYVSAHKVWGMRSVFFKKYIIRIMIKLKGGEKRATTSYARAEDGGRSSGEYGRGVR